MSVCLIVSVGLIVSVCLDHCVCLAHCICQPTLKLGSEKAREQSYVLPTAYTLCLPTGLSALYSPDQEEICGVHV